MTRISPNQRGVVSLLLRDNEEWWSEKISRQLNKATPNISRSIMELISPSDGEPIVEVVAVIGNTKLLRLTVFGKKMCAQEKIGPESWRGN